MQFRTRATIRKAVRSVKFFIHLWLIFSFLISAEPPATHVIAHNNSEQASISTAPQAEYSPVLTRPLAHSQDFSPVFYVGLETLPEVNIHKPSCENDSCSTWVFGNTFGTTRDNAVGLVFSASIDGGIGKKMDCNHAGCNGAATIYQDTSENFASYPGDSTYCTANYAYGYDPTTICDQTAPGSVVHSLGILGFPSVANTNLSGGFAAGWQNTVDVTLRIYDIHFVYYGTPPLIDRSTLSNNQPKNGTGDPRECALDGCANAVAAAGDPINTRTGNFDYSLVDLTLQTIAGPLSFQRSYASLATDTNVHPTDLGPGWTHNQDTRLIYETGTVWFKGHTLNQYKFIDNGNQTYTPYAGVLASLTYDSGNSTYTLKASDQSTYSFNSSGRLVSWRNELGYGFDYTYNANQLYRVTEPVSGRYLQFNYQNGRLASVSDHTARQVSYAYDGNNDLSSYTDSRGKTWTYEYDGSTHRLDTLKDPSNPPKTILNVHYDSQGRADEQFNGKGERIVKITYNADGTSTLEDALGRQAVDGYDGRNTNSLRTDSAGYTIQKGFDVNFRPSVVTDQDGRRLQTTWSADGANLTYIQDAAGYETNLEYSAQNHLIQVTDPRDQSMTFAYNGALLSSATRQTSTGNIVTTYTYTTAVDTPQPVGLLKTITDALNHTTTFIYDEKGQLILARDADEKETYFAYDALGRVTDVTNPLGRVTHYQYDPAGNATKVIQNYNPTKAQNEQNLYNLTNEFFYDDQGRLTQTLNTLGHPTTYSYDDAGRIYQVTDANGKSSTTVYNAAGQVISVTDPLGHSVGYEYDTAGRLWKIKDALDRTVATYAYNLDGTIDKETRPTPDGDTVVRYEYDALKRVVRTWDEDASGNPLGHASSVTYDAYGNQLTRTDALGRVTKHEYNDLGLLAAVVQNYIANPGSGDDPNATNVRTEYTYDEVGNLKKIKDANTHETTFEYDVLNRLWKITNPLEKTTEFGYNVLGNRTSLKDAKNNTTIFGYDLAGRLDVIDYPAGMSDVDFGYDPLGRLTGMDDSLGHTTWAYDNLSRVSSITDPFNKTVGYGYDDDGKRTSITYPSPVSKTISYQYNALDQLEHVLDGSSHLADYSYDVAGRLSGITLGNGISSTPGYDHSGQLTSLTYQKGSAQYAAYSYDYNLVGNRDQAQETLYYPHFIFLPAILNAGEGEQMQSSGASPDGAESAPPDAYPAPGSDSLIQPETQESNPISPDNPYPAPEDSPAGDETSFFQKAWDFLVSLFNASTPTVSAHSEMTGYPAPDSGGGSLPSSTQVIDYGYDALNRLTGATYSDGLDYSYTYDKVGNRTSQTIGSTTTIYQYDEADQLTNSGGVTFTWDNNGNLLNDGVRSYTYDFANRLAAVTGQGSSFSFGYDGLGNRYQQTANGQTTTYTHDLASDLSQVLYNGEFSYYYGLGRISQQKNGVSDYFLTDGLGSVRQLGNSNGNITYGQAFDPFGNSLGWSGLGGSNYGYAGEWSDGSGLQYLRARYYSPAQGRFLTKDPFPGLLTQPASLTPYVYALNNPALLTDPSGEFVETVFDAVSLGYDIYTIGDKLNRGCSLYWSDWAALGLDALSLAVPFLPAAGMAIRFAAHADDFGDLSRLVNRSGDAQRMAMKMETVREAGRVGELMAEIAKNTDRIDSLTGKALYRIPDGLDNLNKVISEVKNVSGKLGYSGQLKDFALYAKKVGYRFDLIVHEGTKFTKPLEKAVQEGLIRVIRRLP